MFRFLVIGGIGAVRSDYIRRRQPAVYRYPEILRKLPYV